MIVLKRKENIKEVSLVYMQRLNLFWSYKNGERGIEEERKEILESKEKRMIVKDIENQINR